jgi:glycosyltransferase involved in cell wall biosynthesis
VNTQTSIALILPCYNPVSGWHENVIKNFNSLKRSTDIHELIIVNDGSIPNEELVYALDSILKLPGARCISYKVNMGKGYALRQGVMQVKSSLIVYTDIDFPYTEESIKNIIAALQEGSTDVAVGVRSEEYYTHLPRVRVRISKALRWFIKKFMRIPVDDTQCGLKGFNQKGKELFLQTTVDRYLFDLEFIFLAGRNKLNIKAIPVTLKPGTHLSVMNWKILMHESGNMLRIWWKSFLS